MSETDNTLRELRGMSPGQFQAALGLGQAMMDAGRIEEAADVLAGLLIYDPFCADVWQALEDLCRRERSPGVANALADVARAMH